MNNNKLSFKKLLKGLYQYELILDDLSLSILSFFFSILTVFLFILLPRILLPKINFPDINDLCLILFIISAFFLVSIISVKISKKRSNRAVFLTVSSIEAIIEDLSDMNLYENDIEKTILVNNLKSLYIFQKIHDYKYCMIVMGSIIEFLLVRYCYKNNIVPEPYTSPNGNVIPATKKHFCNYIQSAIKYNILGQKNSWYLIQNNLRNFRNYVHISKEIKEEEIDYDWYISTKGVFDRIIRNFK